MLELPHALVGAAIGTVFNNPLIAFPASLCSHFITDLFPHWNPHIHTEIKTNGKISNRSLVIIIIDAVLALLIGTLLAIRTDHFLIVFISCFLAVLPDLLEIPYYFFGTRSAFIKKLIGWQSKHQWNTSALIGIASQVIVSFIAGIISLSH